MTCKKVYVCQTNFFLARRYPSEQRRMLNIKNTLLQKVNDTQSDIWGVYSISMQFEADTSIGSSIWVNLTSYWGPTDPQQRIDEIRNQFLSGRKCIYHSFLSVSFMLIRLLCHLRRKGVKMPYFDQTVTLFAP